MGNKCCKSNQSSTYSSANVTIRSFPSSYNSSIVRSGGSHAVTFGTSSRGNSLTNLTMKSSNSDVGRDYRGGSSSTVGQEDPIPVFLRRLNDLNIRVGTRTRFLIELDDPTGVQVRWYHNNLEAESDRYQYIHEGGFYCLDIVPVTLDDEGLWVCTAENYAGKSSTAARLSLTVPKAFKRPVFVEPLRAVLTQRGIVSLECKVVGVPTPKLRWFKDDKEIKAGDIFALTASACSQDCLGVYTCEATNVMGSATSVSKIQVTHSSMDGTCDADSLVPYGPPPKFVKGLKDASGKIGSVLFLECQVEVPPWPRNVGWYNNNGVVNEGPLYHLMADGLGMYGVEIKSLRADHGSTWKCVATSSTGAKAITSCLVSVSYPKNYRVPRFLESLRAIMTDEGLVSFECKVIGYPTPQLSWFKDGKQLQPGDVYELTGSKSLGSYCCVARNCMGETSSLAELTIEDIQNQLNESEKLQLTSNTQPPRFLLGLKSVEANINESFVFMIKVTTESTPPSISWYKEDEELAESNRYRFSTEENGTYMLNIVPLEIDDQAEWKCVAVNKYGQTVTSSFLKLNVPKNFKPPRFLEELRIAFSNEGSVNLECKVIGVPQPLLKWFKDGQELNPGDMHKIISGQSGTCCLGTYTCQAHNCMGTVSSSATLLTMEDKSTVKSCASEEYLSVGNPLVRNESLSTIPEERTSQMEKSYTIEEPADVSFSFDGKEVTVSLYETPDLTHDEALQIIEMYADELSEHISEDNVVDLPSLRIVKESSISGPVMMEALVIDVPVDFCRQHTVSDTEFDGVSLTEDTTLEHNENEDHSGEDSVCDNSLEYFSDHLSSSGGGSHSKRDVFFSASETTPKNDSSPQVSRRRQRSGDDEDDDEHASFRTPKLFMSDSDDQILTQLMLDGENREPLVFERMVRSESSNNCTEEEVSENLLAEAESEPPPPSHDYFVAAEIFAQSNKDSPLYATVLDKIRGQTTDGSLDEDEILHAVSGPDLEEFLGYVKVLLEGTVVKMHARQSFAVADATPTELERSIQALHTLAWRFVDETEKHGSIGLDRRTADNASSLMTAINAGLLALEQIDDPFGVSDNVLNEIQSAVCFDLETLNNRDLSAAEVLDLLSDQLKEFTAVVNKQVARVTEQRVVAVLRNTIGTTLVYIKTLQQAGSKVRCPSVNALTPLFSMVRPLETILNDLAVAEEATSSGHDDSDGSRRGEVSGLKLKQMLIPPISAIAFCLDNLNMALKNESAEEDDPDLKDIYDRINDSTEQFMSLASQGSETKNLAECFISLTKPINDLCCHLRRLGRSTENIVSSDYGSDDKLLMDFETLFDELMMDIDTLINNVNVVRDSENNMNPLGSLLEPLQDMKIGLFQVNQVLLSNQTGSNMSFEVMSCFEHLSHQLVQLNSCIVNQSIVEETDKEIPFESSIKMMQNILFDDAIDDLGVNGILFGSVMKPLLQLQNLIVSKMASVESDLSFSEHTDVTGGAGDTQSLSLSLSNNAQTVLDKTGNDNLKQDNTESSAIDIVVTKKGDMSDDVLQAGISKVDNGTRAIQRDIGAAFKDEEPNIITSEDDRDNSGFEALFDETDLETENDFIEYESLDNNVICSQVDDESLNLQGNEQYIIASVDKENNEIIPEHIMELLDKSVQEDTTLSSKTDLFDELQETLKTMAEATRDVTNDMYLSDDDKEQSQNLQESNSKMIEGSGGDISTVLNELPGEEPTKKSIRDKLPKEDQLEYIEYDTDDTLYRDKTDNLISERDEPLNTKVSEICDQDALKLDQTDQTLETKWDTSSTENIECIDLDKSTYNTTVVPNEETSDPTEIKTEEIDNSNNSENIDCKTIPTIVQDEENKFLKENINYTTVNSPIGNEISLTKDNTLEKMNSEDITKIIVESLIDKDNTLESSVVSNSSAIEFAESAKDSTDVIVSKNDKLLEEPTYEVIDVSIKNDRIENKTVNSSDNIENAKTESVHSIGLNIDNMKTQTLETNKISSEEILIVKDDKKTLHLQDKATVENTEKNVFNQIPQENEEHQAVVEITKKSIADEDCYSEVDKTEQNKSLEDNVLVIDKVRNPVIEVISTETKQSANDSENNNNDSIFVKNLDDEEQFVEQVEKQKISNEINLSVIAEDQIVDDSFKQLNEIITMEANENNAPGEVVTEKIVISDIDLPTTSSINPEKVTESIKELSSEQSQEDNSLHIPKRIIDNDKRNSNDDNTLTANELLENVEQNSESPQQSQITKLLDDKSFVNSEVKTDEKLNEQGRNVSNSTSDNTKTKIETPTQTSEKEPLISSSTTVGELISDDLKNIEKMSEISLDSVKCYDLKLQDIQVSTKIVNVETSDRIIDKKEILLDSKNAVNVVDQLKPDIIEVISIKSEHETPNESEISLDLNLNKSETGLCENTEKKSTIEIINEKEFIKESEKSVEDLKQASILENDNTTDIDECENLSSVQSGNIETAEVTLSVTDQLTALITNETVSMECTQVIDPCKLDENQIQVKYEENREKASYVEKTVFHDKDSAASNLEHSITEEELTHSSKEIIDNDGEQFTSGINELKKDEFELTASMKTEDISQNDVLVETNVEFSNSKEKHEKNLVNAIEFKEITDLDKPIDNKENVINKNIDVEMENFKNELISETAVILEESKEKQLFNEASKCIEIIAQKSLDKEPALKSSEINVCDDLKTTDEISSLNFDSEKKITESKPLIDIGTEVAVDDSDKTVSNFETKSSREVQKTTVDANSLEVSHSPNDTEQLKDLDSLEKNEEHFENQHEKTAIVSENIDNSETISTDKNTKSTIFEVKESKSNEENVECNETNVLINSKNEPIQLQCQVVIEECKSVVDEEVVVLDSTRPLESNDVKVEKVNVKLTENLVDKINVIEPNVSESLVHLNENIEKPSHDNEINAEEISKVSTHSDDSEIKETKSNKATEDYVDDIVLKTLADTDKKTEEFETKTVDDSTKKENLLSESVKDFMTANDTDSQKPTDKSVTDSLAKDDLHVNGKFKKILSDDSSTKTKQKVDLTLSNARDSEVIAIDSEKEIVKTENSDKTKINKLEQKTVEKTKTIDASVEEENMRVLKDNVPEDKVDDSSIEETVSPVAVKLKSHRKTRVVADETGCFKVENTNALKLDELDVIENVTEQLRAELEPEVITIVEDFDVVEESDKISKENVRATQIEKTETNLNKSLILNNDDRNDLKEKRFEAVDNEMKLPKILNEIVEPSVKPKVDKDLLGITTQTMDENNVENKLPNDEKTKEMEENNKIKNKSSPKSIKSPSIDVSKNICESENKIDENVKKVSEKVVEKINNQLDEKENASKLEIEVEQKIHVNDEKSVDKIQEKVSTDGKSENQEIYETDVNKTKTTIKETTNDKDEESKIKKKPSPKSKKSPSQDISKNIGDNENKIEDKIKNVDGKLKKSSEDKENALKLETKVEQEISVNDKKSIDKIKTNVSTDEKSESQKIEVADVNETKIKVNETIKDKDEESKIKKKPSPKSKKSPSQDISKNIGDNENKIQENVKNDDEKLKKLSEDKENALKLETKVEQKISVNDEKSVDKIKTNVSTDKKSESQKIDEADVNETKIKVSETIKDKDEGSKIKKKPSPKSKKSPSQDISKNIGDNENKIQENVKNDDEKLKKLSEDKENALKLETKVEQKISVNDEKSVDKIKTNVSTDKKSESQKIDEADVNETKIKVSETIKDKDEGSKIKKKPSLKSKKLSSPDISKNIQDSENQIEENSKNINEKVDKKLKKPLEDKENDINLESKGEQDRLIDNKKLVDNIDDTEIKMKDNTRKTDDKVDENNKKPSNDTENEILVQTKVEQNISASDKKTSDNIKISDSEKNNKTDIDKTKPSNDETDKEKKKRGSKKTKVTSQQPQTPKSPSPEKSIEAKKINQEIKEVVTTKPNVVENENIISNTKSKTHEKNKLKENEVINEKSTLLESEEDTAGKNKIKTDENDNNEKSKIQDVDKNVIEKTEKESRDGVKQPQFKKSPSLEKSKEEKKDDQKIEEEAKTESRITEDEMISNSKLSEKSKKKSLEESKVKETTAVVEETTKEDKIKSEIHENDKKESIIPEVDQSVVESTEKELRSSVKQKKRRSKHKKSPSPEKTGMKLDIKTDAKVDGKESNDNSTKKSTEVERNENVEEPRDRSKSLRADVEKEIETVIGLEKRKIGKSENRKDSADSKVSDGDRPKVLDETTPTVESKRRVDRSTLGDAHDREPMEKLRGRDDSLVKFKNVNIEAGDVNDRAPYKTVVRDNFGSENRDRGTTREPSSTNHKGTDAISSPDRYVTYDSKRVAGSIDGGSSRFDRTAVISRTTTPLSREFRSSPSIVVESSSPRSGSSSDRNHDLGRNFSKRYLSVTDAYVSRSETTPRLAVSRSLTPRLAASRSLTPEPAWRAGSVARRGWSSSNDKEISSYGGRNYFGGSCRSLSSYCTPEPVTYRCPSETSVRRYRLEDENSSSSSYWAYSGGLGGARRRRGSDSFLHDPGARDGTYYSSWRLSEKSTLIPYTEDLNRTKETFRRLYFCVRLIDQTVCSGATVKFWCSVIGYPEPHVQWYRDGQKLNSYTYNASTRYQTKYTSGLAQLIVDNAQCCDSGEYTCVAVNSRDRITTTGFLTVYTSPSTFGAPRASSKSTLTCTEIYRPQDRLYSWNGENFRGRATDYDWFDDTVAGRLPKYPKFVTGIIVDDLVTCGGTIALQVRVRGSPAPNVTWMRDSKPLPRSSNKYVYLDEGGLYTLLVKDITARDGGAYVCRACNLYGSADAEKTVRVADQHQHHWSSPSSENRGAKPATIVSRPGDRINVAVGEDITVTLRVAGEPKPKVIWMRGSRDVTFLDRSLRETVNDYVKLSIKKAQLSDAGTYFIVAKNVYGSDRAFVTVGVSDRIRISPVPQ